MLCSVTCTVFCDMLFHICGVMLCCIYYVTYVILCYNCNVMVHALYKMHYVTCFATNITLSCITGADSFMLLHMLRFDTLCYIRGIIKNYVDFSHNLTTIQANIFKC